MVLQIEGGPLKQKSILQI